MYEKDADDVSDMTFLARPVRSFESETPFSMDPDSDDLPALIPPAQSTHASQSHVIVDELDAMEAGGDFLSDFARARASSVHRTITERLGIPGGDRALLDVALRQIFSVLDASRFDEFTGDEQVLIVERALGVMRRLAQGSRYLFSPPKLFKATH